MIEAAEALLSDLLNEVELDGDAICKLLCRCAGWLHPPSSKSKHVAATKVVEVSQPGDLQRRVRRLLILALSSLDLSDTATYRVVETAVLYIRQLLQETETSFSSNGKSLAMKQWRQLRELLLADHAQRDGHGATKRKASIEAPEDRKLSTNRSMVIGGMYYPNERVKNLSAVFQAARVVPLKCSQCVESISTTWFWKHPGTGEIYALVPHNGHATCLKTQRKKCPWLSLDGTYTLSDNFQQLDFCDHKRRRSLCKDCGICPHNRQRPLCKECGGHSICPHNRSRYLCKVCGGRGICPHNRQRSACKECGGGGLCPHHRPRSSCSMCKNQVQK